MLMLQVLLGVDDTNWTIERKTEQDVNLATLYFVVDDAKVKVDERIKSREIADGVRGKEFQVIDILIGNESTYILYIKSFEVKLTKLAKTEKTWKKVAECVLTTKKNINKFKLRSKDTLVWIEGASGQNHPIQTKGKKLKVPTLAQKLETITF